MIEATKQTPFRAVAVIIALLLALFAWGFSSPSGSSPDDDFHLASIWCAQGERPGLCESITRTSVSVPAQIPSGSCFAFHNDITGACQKSISSGLKSTDRSNLTSHSYPGGFYWVMSWFAGPNVTTSVLLMRVLNSLIFIAMAALTFFLVANKYRRALVIAVGATIVPLGMFIVASTNPSSWALYSPLFIYLLGRSLVEAQISRKSWLIAALTMVIAAFAAAARADAAVFVLLAFGLSLWGSPKRWLQRPEIWVTGSVMTLTSLLSVIGGRQSGSALSGLADSANGGGIGLLVKNLLEIPALYTGALGGWGLGWLDTTPPAIVFASLTLLLGGITFGAIALKASRKEFVVPIIMFSFMIAIPLVMSQGAGASIGTFVQPRYVLPLLALTLITLITTQSQSFLVSPREVTLGIVIVACANAVSLYINVSRYSTGLSNMAFNLNSGAWQPTGSALGVLFVGVAAFAVACLLSHRWLTDSTSADYAVDRVRLR